MTVAPDLIAFANRLADTSGAVIKPLFRQRIDVAHKQGRHDFDPVTEADKGAERAIRELLAKERPNDGILGEEYGEQKGSFRLPLGAGSGGWHPRLHHRAARMGVADCAGA